MIRILIITFALSSIICSQAQDDTTALKRGTVYPGYFITLDGDTVHGYILNSNLWYNQTMVFYYKDSTDRENRIKFRAKEIKGYKVGNRIYDSFKHPGSYSTHSYNFFYRRITGPLCYYIWYYDPDRGNLSEPVLTLEGIAEALILEDGELWTQDIVRKGDGELIDVNPIGFAKKMSQIIEDEPELAKKIKNKEEGYRSIDMLKIVEEYNAKQADKN